MPIFEVTGWTMVEAADANEAFSIAARLLVGHGWDYGEMVDVRLLPPDEADNARTEPVSDELRAEWKKWTMTAETAVFTAHADRVNVS